MRSSPATTDWSYRPAASQNLQDTGDRPARNEGRPFFVAQLHHSCGVRPGSYATKTAEVWPSSHMYGHVDSLTVPPWLQLVQASALVPFPQLLHVVDVVRPSPQVVQVPDVDGPALHQVHVLAVVEPSPHVVHDPAVDVPSEHCVQDVQSVVPSVQVTHDWL